VPADGTGIGCDGSICAGGGRTTPPGSAASRSIILMHDFQKYTAEALLSRLEAGGYKAVQM
jgi:hypothetical protein